MFNSLEVSLLADQLAAQVRQSARATSTAAVVDADARQPQLGVVAPLRDAMRVIARSLFGRAGDARA